MCDLILKIDDKKELMRRIKTLSLEEHKAIANKHYTQHEAIIHGGWQVADSFPLSLPLSWVDSEVALRRPQIIAQSLGAMERAEEPENGAKRLRRSTKRLFLG